MWVSESGAARAAEPVVTNNDRPAVETAQANAVETAQPDAGSGVRANEAEMQAGMRRYQLTPPAPEPTALIDPQAKADELISEHGGKDDLDTDGLGRDLADLARQNPADARLVSDQIYGSEIDQDGEGRLRERDKDEVAQSMVDNLSDDDLTRIAQTDDGRRLLGKAQAHLLAGHVAGDERDSANRVQRHMDRYVIFGEGHQGVDPAGGGATAFDPEASATDAAAAIKGGSGAFGNENAPDVRAFAYQLKEHANDPAWQREFLRSLGSDKTAQLVSAAVETSTYSINGSAAGSAEYMRDNVATIRGALENAGLSQYDMENLVGALPENPYAASEIFAGSTNNDFKASFVRAAVANGSDYADAAASHVLASMPESRQASMLREFSRDGSLNSFIEGAMAGQQQVNSLGGMLTTDQGPYDQTTFGGVGRLLATANKQTSAPYPPYSLTPAFDPALQRDLFNAAAQGLDDPAAMKNFENDTAFKDDLSQLFINNRDALFRTDQREGAFTDDFVEGMSRFAQLTLMTEPPGGRREELQKNLFGFFNEASRALNDPDLVNLKPEAIRAFKDAHGGMDPRAYSQMTGELLGSIVQGTGYAQEAENQDQAARQAQVEMLTGLAFAMLPSAAGKLAEGAVGTFLGAAEDYARGETKDAIDKLLVGDPDDAAARMNEVATALYDDTERQLSLGNTERTTAELREPFQNGFDNATRYTNFDAEHGG